MLWWLLGDLEMKKNTIILGRFWEKWEVNIDLGLGTAACEVSLLKGVCLIL